MRKLLNKKTLLFVLMLTFVSIGGALATITSTNEVINHVSIDTVDIELDEYMYKDDQLVKFEYDKLIYPGDLIPLIPQIKNKGVDAYIRIKIDFPQFKNADESVKETLDVLSLDDINGFEHEKWVYQDDYYYYQDVLKEEQAIHLFESIQVPTEWGNEYQSMSFDVVVEVDAVQVKNFTPDYTSSNPWGNVTPEKTVRTRMDR